MFAFSNIENRTSFHISSYIIYFYPSDYIEQEAILAEQFRTYKTHYYHITSTLSYNFFPETFLILHPCLQK